MLLMVCRADFFDTICFFPLPKHKAMHEVRFLHGIGNVAPGGNSI